MCERNKYNKAIILDFRTKGGVGTFKSKEEDKDQESIQSSTTSHLKNILESNKNTKNTTHKRANMFKPSGFFYWPFHGSTLFVDPFSYSCFTLCFITLSCLFLAVLWSPAWKGLTSLLSCVRCFPAVFSLPYCVSGQVWYLIWLIPDLCLLLYFTYFIFLCISDGVLPQLQWTLFTVFKGTK